jgi:hypothetical protein
MNPFTEEDAQYQRFIREFRQIGEQKVLAQGPKEKEDSAATPAALVGESGKR